MGNIRVNKPTGDFEMVPRSIIWSGDVLTVGVYVKLLCLGDGWELNIKGLARTMGISADKVRASITFLEREGFLTRTPKRTSDNAKFAGWEYTLWGVRVDGDSRTNAGSSVSQFQTTLKSDLSENGQDNINIVKLNNNIPPMCITSISHDSDINIPIIQNTDNTLSPKGEDVFVENFREAGNGKKKSSPKAPSFAENVERIYAAYPSRDKATVDYPKGRCLGKCSKDRLKIERYLKDGIYTEAQLMRAIEFCIKEHPRGYMPNFGTFLNNIPEIPEEPVVKEKKENGEIDWTQRMKEKNEWYANGAREEDMPQWIREVRAK